MGAPATHGRYVAGVEVGDVAAARQHHAHVEDRGQPLEATIIQVHLQLMSTFPDSLIARKCGAQVAQQSAMRAERALNAGTPGEAEYLEAVADLDFWLRSDGHRRNPGTTADMIAAGLFSLLRDGIINSHRRGALDP